MSDFKLLTPLRVETNEASAYVLDAAGWLVATLPGYPPKSKETIGKEIVRSVNAHAALVEACKEAEIALAPICFPDAPIMLQLRAALALAKGEK